MLTEWLSDAKYRLRAIFRRGDLEHELDEELRQHIEREAAKHARSGVPHDEALRRARLAFGGLERIKEDSRDARGISWLETLAQDTGYALRRLRAAPGFTAVTVLTLALGIGATTAIWSAVNPILFQPLPYPDARRIITISDRQADGSRADVTFGTYREVVARSHLLEAAAAYKPWQPTLLGGTQPERLDGQRVNAAWFRVLGVAPAMGRDFDAAEDQAGGAAVVILSDGLWRRRFGGDSAIVGRSITLDGAPVTVIGVMPRNFENVLAPGAAIWRTLQYDMSEGRAWGHHLRMVGRVKPGVSTREAELDLAAIARDTVAEYARVPWAAVKDGFLVSSLQADVTRGVRDALLAVLVAVTLVLVIACVNVTNLLLARGAQRRAEFALRAALGAGRRRLVRQLLTESVVLALAGGAAGIALAVAGVRALVALSPAGLPRAGAIGIDGGALAFGLAISTLVGLVFGLAPAIQAAHEDPHAELQHGSRRNTGGHHRTRAGLVVAEVALALVLLVSSGLLLRSLNRLFAVSSGFDSSGVLTMQVNTSGARYVTSNDTTRLFFERALAAVRRVPGVTSAALTSQLPLSGDVDLYGARFDPAPAADPGESGGGTFRYAVSPGYIETMHIPLRAGRTLGEQDVAGAPLVALISESLARRRLPGIDPIGRRLRLGGGGPYTVVGVVGDVKQTSLAVDEAAAVYVTPAQWAFADNAMSLVIRTRGEPAALAPAIRQAVWSVDKDQAVVRVLTMNELVAASTAQRRFALTIFEAFALAALILAAAGIYGVLAGSVAERTREIGVRAALGASRGMIVGLVVRQGLALTGLGIVIGVAGATLASRGLVTMLFGVSALDPVTYLGVVFLLASVALVACCVPAWRAARVDPASTLRSD